MNYLQPISLYIHIPWCVKKCPYCDFNSHQNKTAITLEQENNYINSLILDLTQTLNYLQLSSNLLPLKSIFIGGGTPSLFSALSINNLLTKVNQLIPLSNNCEITLEANPGTFESQKFTDLKKAGINRLSIGVQSFDNQSLQLLGRIHDSEQAKQAISRAKDLDFNLNIDLMHSLPNQTLESAMSDLKTAIDFSPNHLSWYQLTIEPNTVFAKQPPKLPNDDILDNIYYNGLDYLTKNNYTQYEISAFIQNSLNKNKSVHNLNYWHYGDYIGIGAGAHSKYCKRIKNNKEIKVIRQWKQKSPIRYLDNNTPKISGTSELTPSEILLEYMMNRLRILKPLSEQELLQYTALSFKDLNLIDKIKQAESKLWLKVQGNQLTVTELGRQFLNDLILLFA